MFFSFWHDLQLPLFTGYFVIDGVALSILAAVLSSWLLCPYQHFTSHITRSHKTLCVLTDACRSSCSYLLGSLFSLKQSNIFSALSLCISMLCIIYLSCIYHDLTDEVSISLVIHVLLSFTRAKPFLFYSHNAVYNDLKQNVKKKHTYHMN